MYVHFLAAMRASNISIVVDNAKRPIIGSATELSRPCPPKASAVAMAKPLRGSTGDLNLACMSTSAPTNRTPKSSSSKRATPSSHAVSTSCNSSSSYIMSPGLVGDQSHRRRRTSSTSFVNMTDSSPRMTKVAKQVQQNQPRKNSMSKEYIDGFRVWSDHEENERGTRDYGNVAETSTRVVPVVVGRDNYNHFGSPLRVQRKQIMSELLIAQSEQEQQRKQRVPQHRHSSTPRQRPVMEELMTHGHGGGIKTPTQTLTRMVAKQPTPPRRRERLHRRETPCSC
jgi:hypothetical protein